MLILAGAIVIITALAIALSKIIPMLLLIAGVIAFGTWVFVKSGKLEITKLVDYIRDLLDKLRKLIGEKEEELQQVKGDPADFSLLQLLSMANEEERAGLEKFVGTSFESPEQFDLTVRKKATHDIRSLIKRIKGVEKEFSIASYSDMLDLVGNKLKLKREGRIDRDFEAHLVKTAFDKMVESMDEKDRKLLEHEIAKYADAHLGKKNLTFALSSSGLVAANLGGFATYTMASSLLAGVSSSLGVGLPFAAYTTLSSALSAVMGPIGIITLGSWGLHKITSPNIKVTILTVLAVASIRERLMFEFPEKRQRLKKEIESYKQQQDELEVLQAKVNSASMLDAIFKAVTNSKNHEAIEHLPETEE